LVEVPGAGSTNTSVNAREDVENDILPAELIQRDLFEVFASEGKCGGLGACGWQTASSFYGISFEGNGAHGL
jgi:hypothetical protein